MHKRDNTYYFTYSQNFTNGSADIAYMTGTSPMGPFTFKGTMLPNSASGGGNNHAGVVQYKNNWYVFYHDRRLRTTNGVSSGEYRSVSVDKLEYNADGTMKQVVSTVAGPEQLKNFNPYDTVLATTMFQQSGTIKTAIRSAATPGTVGNSPNNTTANANSAGASGDRNVMLVNIANGNWVRLKSVDFGTAGAAKFYAGVASASAGGKIEIRTGSNTGTLIGTCNVPATGSVTTWNTVECDITAAATGVKDYLYLVFTVTSTNQFRLGWYKFGAAESTTSVTAGGAAHIRPPFSVSVRGKSLFITATSPAAVEIYNIKGGKEASVNVSGATQTVKLSLPDGVYFAKARGTRNVKFTVR
jgi:arabinoxylan arabinofuranohydrolase